MSILFKLEAEAIWTKHKRHWFTDDKVVKYVLMRLSKSLFAGSSSDITTGGRRKIQFDREMSSVLPTVIIQFALQVCH